MLIVWPVCKYHSHSAIPIRATTPALRKKGLNPKAKGFNLIVLYHQKAPPERGKVE